MNKTNETKGIGFKNFRRFENFPILEFGKITFMVGRNNSGKSTLVKALLLVMDYLQNQLSDTFSFDNKVLEDANIVTFGRAKCSWTDEPEIKFHLKLNNYDIAIIISGDDDSTIASVDYFSVRDQIKGYTLLINYSNKTVFLEKESLSFDDEPKAKKEFILKIKNEIKELTKSLIRISKISKEGLRISDRINKLNDQLKQLSIIDPDQTIIRTDYKVLYKHKEEDDSVRTEDNELKEHISVLLYKNSIAYRQLIEKRAQREDDEGYEESSSNIENLHNSKEELLDWINDFVKTINAESYFYIGANPSKQSALFPLRAKDNALAQAIHEFKQLGILKGEPEWEFVKKWMHKFELGDDFKIEFYAGEAYEFHVFKTNSKTNNPTKIWNHLADKGMGSLQAMLLILRVANLIRKNTGNTKKITLLIEEPELNLHPALQSLLTEFFHEVNLEYGINFIVETHSEYVIRKAQLMSLEYDYISNQELNPNPFKIVYFSKEEGPYEMRFTEQGRFERDFGPGFYDTAAKISMEIIEKGRKNKEL